MLHRRGTPSAGGFVHSASPVMIADAVARSRAAFGELECTRLCWGRQSFGIVAAAVPAAVLREFAPLFSARSFAWL